jgi:hypothetical protein
MDVRVNDVALQGGRRDSEEPRQQTKERVVEPIVDEDLPF